MNLCIKLVSVTKIERKGMHLQEVEILNRSVAL